MRDVKGRHELKHYINYSDFLQLKSRLSIVTLKDKNELDEEGYKVRSLYFDNFNDKALLEKIHGVNEREKFRLRLYNDNPTFIRLEKKSKKDGVCYKKSTVISYTECQKLLEGKIEVLKENGDLLMLELYTKMLYENLKPKNIVYYTRKAYVYAIGNVRITMDYNIRTSFDVKSFINPNIITVPLNKGIILEVKYDEFLPEIIRGIIMLSSRQNTAFSKYAVTRII